MKVIHLLTHYRSMDSYYWLKTFSDFFVVGFSLFNESACELLSYKNSDYISQQTIHILNSAIFTDNELDNISRKLYEARMGGRRKG